MTKKEVKKKAYKEIIKGGRGHQEVYDELATTKASFNKEIATQLSEIPSKSIRAKYQTLLYVYIGLLALFALIRLLGISALTYGQVNPILLAVFLLLSLVLPGFGIYGAQTLKLNLLKSTSFILIIFTIRGLTQTGIIIEDLTWLIPLAFVVALGFYLPSKMKTSYTATLVKDKESGKSQYNIIFKDDLSIDNDELLDNNLI